ncbi:nitroimidazol reductase NimA-like FMN-containing flavoprotein (pyridoxamine 5'-phosphate oxidase superfamily) [Labrys wisconsinensis]|uniref:Nitroimidazol reductase NimA-like FMN-containing flavoprotein (Pyridoxamine 5'-phosphate oxidase superfamily) n=1 Tax=Labrys wisconsinensis TaxID=425677 RepID=A0ABU0JJJ7_9HYPH|nr:pyridoxamine 5'-phosphate oxidase family protein [Labrys wisconsinensis]MDQ0473578.1 nitroimidazol reductase NimA-like FMN-containing flavoprotein (pyridoxamine 5'-phosphate oxidase superfamily) [Labrys wisconsinensis]
MTADPIAPSDTFPVTVRNRVRRLHERGHYDREAVYAVLDAGMLCHVAYVFDGQPYCTPTMHWREDDRLYWHGSSASRMLRQLKPGVPACLTVAHLDGLVLARSGFNHSANYRSAMCFGTAGIVDDPEEKARALHGVVNRFFPGRAAELRATTGQESKATTVIGMRIEEASAKVRAKGVGDDEEDYGHPVWAGVIPVRTVIGADEPCPRLKPGIDRSEGLAAYREGRRLDEALLETQDLYAAAEALAGGR